VLWWIGNAVFVLVVIPVVVFLLLGLRKSVVDIGTHVDVIHDRAGHIVTSLGAVPALLKVRDLVKSVGAKLLRYANAVDRLL
jgi:hypothetical protein